MINLRSILPLLLITVLAASNITLIEFATAVVSEPSVPEFTVQLVAHPYDIPVSTSIDPYTGKTITSGGERIDNRSIEVMIKNQAVPSLATGESYILGYSIRIKGHFIGDNWKELYYWQNGTDSLTFLSQSENESTLFSQQPNFPPGSQIDYQVEAVLGHRVITQILRTGMWPFETVDHPIFVIDATSGWSDSQTVTITEVNPATNQPISGIGAFFGLSWVQTAIALLIGVAIGVVLILAVGFLRKRRKNH
jgi:hypothetical protein